MSAITPFIIRYIRDKRGGETSSNRSMDGQIVLVFASEKPRAQFIKKCTDCGYAP